MQFDSTTTILLATLNAGKTRELATLLLPFSINVVNLSEFPSLPEVEETGSTFLENALLKARAGSAATGLVAIADDSGLEVDALDKAPGIYSARYSATPEAFATDEKNLHKILDNLQNIPSQQRTARFRCCMAAAAPKGDFIVGEGAWEGTVAEQPAGENGFGYDPIFYDPDLALTAAQMTPEQKNNRSHRGLATQALLAKWPAFWQQWLAR